MAKDTPTLMQLFDSMEDALDRITELLEENGRLRTQIKSMGGIPGDSTTSESIHIFTEAQTNPPKAEQCSRCNGTGMVPNPPKGKAPCPRCAGGGEVHVLRRHEANPPKGMAHSVTAFCQCEACMTLRSGYNED